MSYDKKKAWLAIDIGMTHTKGALYHPKLGVKQVRMSGSDARPVYICPTVLVLESMEKLRKSDIAGAFLVGDEAERKRGVNINNLSLFKMEIPKSNGHTFPDYPNETVSWDQILAAFILYIRDLACEQFLEAKKLSRCVLTVPYTILDGTEAWKVMHRAATLAGFSEIRIISEATAAAVYAYSKLRNDEKVSDGDVILVYDYGGATFDPALIQSKGGSSSAIYRLFSEYGGKPVGLTSAGVVFDDLIRNWLFETFPEIFEEIKKISGNLQKSFALEKKLNQFCCQEIKENCFGQSDKDIFSDFEPIKYNEFSITRDEFYELIEQKVDQTISECQELIAKSGVEWSDIKRVVLVGGTSNIPIVREKIQEMLNNNNADQAKILWKSEGTTIDLMHAVVLGAAEYIPSLPSPSNLFKYAQECLEREHYHDSRYFCEQAIKLGLGSSIACTFLGNLYRNGLGVGKSSKEALIYYLEAFLNGCPEAAFNIAIMHYKGEGVRKNNQVAQQILSLILPEVHFESPDSKVAKKLVDFFKMIYGKAPESLIDKANEYFALTEALTIQGHSIDLAKILEVPKLEDNKLLPEAFFVMGEIYLWNVRDVLKARLCYDKASSLGYSKASFRLNETKLTRQYYGKKVRNFNYRAARAHSTGWVHSSICHHCTTRGMACM